MRKRNTSLIIAASVLAVCLATALLSRTDEPRWQGRPLSYWSRIYAGYATPERAQATEAISQIGTNALPQLLHWIEYIPPAWRSWLTKARDPEYGRGWSWIPVWATSAQRQNFAEDAMMAFHALGSAGRAAIPRLGELARRPERALSSRASIALAGIGPDAIPELLSILSDTNLSPHVRFEATREFNELAYRAAVRGNLGTTAVPAVPYLTQNLNDTDEYVAAEAAALLGTLRLFPDTCVPALRGALKDSRTIVRIQAASALGKFNDAARPAVPNLLDALADRDADVRSSATNALRQIAPGTVTILPAQ